MGCMSTSLTQVLTSLPLKPSVARPNAWRATPREQQQAHFFRQQHTHTYPAWNMQRQQQACTAQAQA